MITQKLTPAEFENAKSLLAANGIHISSNEGTIMQEGATIGYQYDGVTLQVNVEHTLPFEGGFVTGKIVSGLKQSTPNEPVTR